LSGVWQEVHPAIVAMYLPWAIISSSEFGLASTVVDAVKIKKDTKNSEKLRIMCFFMMFTLKKTELV
jgi:hypothetical protein